MTMTKDEMARIREANRGMSSRTNVEMLLREMEAGAPPAPKADVPKTESTQKKKAAK